MQIPTVVLAIVKDGVVYHYSPLNVEIALINLDILEQSEMTVQITANIGFEELLERAEEDFGNLSKKVKF